MANNRDLFVAPPPEIGRVICACSEVRIGQTLLPLYVKLGIASVFVVFSIAALTWFKTHSTPGEKPGTVEIVVGFGSICLAIVAVAFAFKPSYLAYIGDKGAAVYTTRGTRNDVAAQVIRYADVVDVQTVEGGQSKGSTDLITRFVDAQGQTLMKIRGKVRSSGREDVPRSIAIATEAAWQRATASRVSGRRG